MTGWLYSIVIAIAQGAAVLAILGVGVVFGTDAFCALVLRPALARVDDVALVSVMGNVHRYGDQRMPVPGAIGLLASAATSVLAGITGHLAAAVVVGAGALLLVIWLLLYARISAPINRILTAAADRGETLDTARALQADWDRIIVLRTTLQGLAWPCSQLPPAWCCSDSGWRVRWRERTLLLETRRETMQNPIGRALRTHRAGHHTLAWADPDMLAAENFALSSAAFEHGAPIPERHRGHIFGSNVSPALVWTAPPAGTVELVLIVQDPDSPGKRPATHALAAGIEPGLRGLAENALVNPSPVAGLRHGKGPLGRLGWAGPAPIPSHGPHSYVFQLFALDRHTQLPERFTLAEAMDALAGHLTGRARLDGTYEIA